MEKMLIDTGPSERGWHRLETALRCPQLYAYKYKMPPGVFADSSEPLVRGTLGHIGLAHYYARLGCAQTGQDPERFYDPLEAISQKVERMQSIPGTAAQLAREMHDIAREAVAAYMANYLHETLAVKRVEFVVKMNFGRRYLTQRFDLVVEDSNKKLFVYDHKFVSAIQHKSVERYALSGQFLEMVHQGRNAFGDAFGGVRINLVGVEDKKFLRVAPPNAPFALETFPETVEHAELMIDSWEGMDPWHHPKASSEVVCVTPYGYCPAYELCKWGPQLGSNVGRVDSLNFG